MACLSISGIGVAISAVAVVHTWMVLQYIP